MPDTPGRDAHAAKTRPKKVPKRKTAAQKRADVRARNFAAATSIFVPPELQRAKPIDRPRDTPGRDVVFKVKPRPVPESALALKKLAQETEQRKARERYQLGFTDYGPTGANDLRGVPAIGLAQKKRNVLASNLSPLEKRRAIARLTRDARTERTVGGSLGGFGKTVGSLAAAGGKSLYGWAEDRAGDLADLPGELLYGDTNPRSPIPESVQRAGQTASKLPGAKEFVRTTTMTPEEQERVAEEIFGKALTNLVVHGDTPGTGMEAAGLGVGILGILPFGKISQLAKIGKAARAAGKAGDPLPMTPARQAAYDALVTRYGTEQADDLMPVIDNVARQTAKSKADEVADIVEPDDWYKKTDFRVGDWADVKDTPGMKAAQFQWRDNPDTEYMPGPGDDVRVPDGRVGWIEQRWATDDHRVMSTVLLEDGSRVQELEHRLVHVLPDKPRLKVGDAVTGAPGTRREQQQGNVVHIDEDGRIGVQFLPHDSSVEYHSPKDLLGKPDLKSVKFQTEAGPRYGLVEGSGPSEITLGKKAAFKRANKGDIPVLFMTRAGNKAIVAKEAPGEFRLTVWKESLGPGAAPETQIINLDQARMVLNEGTGHHYMSQGEAVPVFYSELKRQVEKQVPERGLDKAETAKKLEAAVKPGEWSDSGMQAFIDSYPDGTRIPKADIQQHLSTSLNAYDLDEVIYVSGDPGTLGPYRDKWGPGNQYLQGRLTVRDPSPDQPYVEIAMRLRKPMHTRKVRGAFAEHETLAPYRGKGRDHWTEDDVIGHVRFHIVIDNDGKRALVLDEIQSDWASQWRKVKAIHPEAQQKIDEAKDKTRRIEQELWRLEDEGMDGTEEYRLLEEEWESLSAEMEKYSAAAEIPGPPPLGQKQMEALVRRTLRYAHDSGVERIIIVGGDVQALRNNAYQILPDGTPMQVGEDIPIWQQNEEMREWFKQVKDMSPPVLRAYLNDPMHAETPMVKTFRRLYGTEGKAGDIPVIFEKEMGVKGAQREEIFQGGYSDQHGSVRRLADQQQSFDGVQYKMDETHYGFDSPPKPGDVVGFYDGIGQLVRITARPGEDLQSPMATIRMADGTRKEARLEDLNRMRPDDKVYPGHYPMDGYVIEMTPEAHAKAAVPMPYYQQRAWETIPKGATEFFADGRRAIHLFEDADVSTVIHELAHVALNDMGEVDRAIIMRHFNGLRTTADHEMYARSLERYVYDGMAIKSELDGVFAKLRNWMHIVYQHANNIGAVVNPEVKQVFDRMMVQQESPAEQLVRLLKSAPPVRKAQAAGYSEERSRRIAEMMEAWNETGGVDEFRMAMYTLKGELPKEAFTGLDELAPEAVESLVKAVRVSPKVRGYEKVRAVTAIIKATDGGVPTDSELALLHKIFGDEVGFNKVRRNGIDRILVEIWNIPRSLSATLDLSAPLRQGAIAGARHPKIFIKNLTPMLKAAYRAKYAENVAEDIATRPNASLYQRAKLAVETHASDPNFANREEAFYSSYADKLPVVKQSSRAYETFLHKMRADVFDHMIVAARKENIKRVRRGKPPVDVESEKFLLGLGKYINSITGRGVMPNTELFPFEQAAPFFNTLFFSPRLLASRLNMISPVYYAKLWRHDPFIAKQALRAMRNTVAGAVTTLLIADQMPGVDVGIDPTSANFGKIRIGDTRVDILAGFGPLSVLIARMSLGYSTSSTTGKRQDLKGGFGESSRKDILYRFGESKFAPTTGIIRDVLGGQNFIGEPVTWQSELKNNFLPMMARDAWEVGHEPSDPTEAVVAAAMVVLFGGLGLGFSSYPNKAAKSRGGGSSEPDQGGVPEGWGDGSTGGGAPEGWSDDVGGGLPEGW